MERAANPMNAYGAHDPQHELSDTELDALLAAADEELLAYVQRTSGAASVVLTIMDASADTAALLIETRGSARELDLTLGLLSQNLGAQDVQRAARMARELDCALTQIIDRTLDVVDARALARSWDLKLNLDPDLARDLDLGITLVRNLTQARNLASEIAFALSTAKSQGTAELANLLSCIINELPIDACGADLSKLDIRESAVLVGVVWTAETIWPPHMTDQIRSCSREIRPGVYEVHGDGKETFIDQTPTLSPAG